MKKLMMTLLSLVLALSLPLAAFAQEEIEMDTLLEGLVIEIVEGGFLMEDIHQGAVMVNTSEETVPDGVLLEEDLAVGMYVMVDFNGMMTRSLPPQVHGDRVGCYRLDGAIAEILEDGTFLLTGDAIYDEVIVHMTQEMNLFVGMPITVYYSGAVAMSLPTQASALHIIVPTLEGAVSELTEEGFTLTDSEGAAYEVKLTDETILSLQAEEAEEETAGNEERVEEDAQAEVLLELMDGQTVKVIYNGMLSRSIPVQLSALEIIIQR